MANSGKAPVKNSRSSLGPALQTSVNGERDTVVQGRTQAGQGAVSESKATPVKVQMSFLEPCEMVLKLIGKYRRPRNM